MAEWGVIFDSDGVLVDSEAISDQGFVETVAEFAPGVVIGEQEMRTIIGSTELDCVQYLNERFNINIPAQDFVAASWARYQKNAEINSLEIFPDVRELLDELDAESIPYGVASSGNYEKINFNLGRLGILNRFKVILSGEDFKKGKPEPHLFLSVAEKLGILPQHCIVIEDSANGIEAACRAGMKSIAVTNTMDASLLSKADLIVGSLEEINIDLLRELIAKTNLRE